MKNLFSIPLMSTEDSLSKTLVQKITYLIWISIWFYALVDYSNGIIFSSLVLSIIAIFIFPIIIILQKKNYELPAKLLLIFFSNVTVFISTASTPYDDGGRFFFVPISMLTFLLFEPYQIKSVLFGLTNPLIFYFLSFQFPITLFLNLNPNIDIKINKFLNFIGVYIIAITEIFFFVKYIVRLRVQTEYQSKFSALGVMSSGIAHEINNPLTIIKGKVSIITKNLKKSSLLDEKTQKDLELINFTTDRITRIVKGLRIFSRDSVNDPFAETSSKRIIQIALDLCSEKFQVSGIKIEVTGLPHFEILGNETQLVQVMINLLHNAHDALIESSEKWIRIEIGDHRISIIDSGLGIPNNVAKNLMQPFFTTKEAGKGTGLGLSISKGIMQHHGGNLFLDSQCKNTKFVIQFIKNHSQLN